MLLLFKLLQFISHLRNKQNYWTSY